MKRITVANAGDTAFCRCCHAETEGRCAGCGLPLCDDCAENPLYNPFTSEFNPGWTLCPACLEDTELFGAEIDAAWKRYRETCDDCLDRWKKMCKKRS